MDAGNNNSRGIGSDTGSALYRSPSALSTVTKYINCRSICIWCTFNKYNIIALVRWVTDCCTAAAIADGIAALTSTISSVLAPFVSHQLQYPHFSHPKVLRRLLLLPSASKLLYTGRIADSSCIHIHTRTKGLKPKYVLTSQIPYLVQLLLVHGLLTASYSFQDPQKCDGRKTWELSPATAVHYNRLKPLRSTMQCFFRLPFEIVGIIT